jgi:eukaryotic-like serine/threonine-protein kinase
VALPQDGGIGGRYELVRRIARGGGGTVWRAQDTVLGRPVAVKSIDIPDELPHEERERIRARVRYEGRAAARLDHPAAVVVHDVLEAEDRLHLVMELVEAPTLRQQVQRDGPLPEHEVARIGLGLAEILGLAHDRGIVHRDVKPSNVFVLDDGIKLADFGIVALAGETNLTRTGVALGSPSFLAPEQARGEPAAPPADLWGLGATLYYAVEGAPPFEREHTIATVNAVVHDPPRPFEHAERTGPLLRSLLSKDAADRPTLDVVTEELRRLEQASPDPAGAPPASAARIGAIAGPPSAGDDPSAGTDAGTIGPPLAEGAPEDRPPPTATGASAGSRRRRAALALAGLAVLALAVVGFVTLTEDRGSAPISAIEGDGQERAPDEDDGNAGDEEATADQAPDADEGAVDEDTGGVDDDTGEGDEPADAGSDGDGAGDGRLVIPESEVPDGWQVVEGATYRLAIPAGWEERTADGNLTDYVDPETGAYLRVDWTDDPADDPVADWEANEAGFAQRQDDYERIRLEPATYRGEDAALWEYTYAAGGADLRAVNLNLLAGDRAYALNLQSPAEDWDEVGALFPHVTGGFEPAG